MNEIIKKIEDNSTLVCLEQAEVVPLPITVEYWSPQAPGESKRVYVAGIQPTEILDIQKGEIKTLSAVYLLEVTAEGQVKKWMTAAAVLVGAISEAIRRGQIIPGTDKTPVKITFLGKVKNRTNAMMSNRWEILPLVVNQ